MFILAFTNLRALTTENLSSKERLPEINSSLSNAENEIRILDTLLSELIANPDNPRDDLPDREGNQIITGKDRGTFIDYIPEADVIQRRIDTARAYVDQLAVIAAHHVRMTLNPNSKVNDPTPPIDAIPDRPGIQTLNAKAEGGFIDYIPDANFVRHQLIERALETIVTDLILNPDNPRDDSAYRLGNQINLGDGTSIDYVPDLNQIQQQLYEFYAARETGQEPSYDEHIR